MAAHVDLAVLHEHSPVVLQFLCFPTTEATKPKGTVRAPQTAIFPLVFGGAGYRSPTLTICRNRLLAKNAKGRHGLCSEIICFSNSLSALWRVHRLNSLQAPLPPGYWNATLGGGLYRSRCAAMLEAVSAAIFASVQLVQISSNIGSAPSSCIFSSPCISPVSSVTDTGLFCPQTIWS
jgi:hypothetical protein